jgi:hypothetical protein
MRRGFFVLGGVMEYYAKLEEVFGKGCNSMKIADAIYEGIEDYEIDGETGETVTIWNWIEEVEGVAV